MKATKSSLSLLFALVATAVSAQTLSNYQFVVSSQSPDHYFKLDNTLNDAVDPSIVLDSFGVGGFTFDTFRNNGDSYFYVNATDFLRINGTTNLINGGGVSNTVSTAAGAITFLFRTLDPGAVTGQRFLFSAGGNVTNHDAFALFQENNNAANGDTNSIKFRFGNTTTTILDFTNIAPNTWYYFAVSYSETAGPNKTTWYIGRPGATLFSGITANAIDSVAGDGLGVLMIGNHTNLAGAWRSPGSGQLDEFATWRRQLTSTEVGAQFAALPSRVPPAASTYQSLITAQSPSYYFKLDSNRSNALALTPVLSTVGPTVGFTYDYFGNFATTNAAAFVAVNDTLVVSNNLLNGGGAYNGTPGTGKGTISFLFNSLSGTNVSGQRFLFSAGGATGTTNGFGVYMENLTSTDPAAIKVRFGHSSKPILQPQDIVLGDWYYCAVTYDESLASQQVQWLLGQPGGPLNSGTLSYDVGSLAGQTNIFVIGNHTNFNAGWRNPGTGRIDEFAIWPRVLTATEITNQFVALTPTSAVVASPNLSIALSGQNVLLSWPSSTPSTYALEVTNVLDATAPGWPSAGSASVVGTNYVVTNAVSSGARFYRLHKP